jgi:hypothetical protein
LRPLTDSLQSPKALLRTLAGHTARVFALEGVRYFEGLESHAQA